MTPRKHAELIKAWADGAEIRRFVVPEIVKDYRWVDDPFPTWADDEIYRIKEDCTIHGWAHFPGYPSCEVRALVDGKTGEPKKLEIVK